MSCCTAIILIVCSVALLYTNAANIAASSIDLHRFPQFLNAPSFAAAVSAAVLGIRVGLGFCAVSNTRLYYTIP